jgi:antitoxin VapB
MALHINNPEVEQKVRQMAALTGESITDAIGTAVNERLHRVRNTRGELSDPTVEEVLALVRSFGLQPINQDLSEDEILGYGPHGYCE